MAKIIVYNLHLQEDLKKRFNNAKITIFFDELIKRDIPFNIEQEATQEQFADISVNQRAIEAIYESANQHFNGMFGELLKRAIRDNQIYYLECTYNIEGIARIESAMAVAWRAFVSQLLEKNKTAIEASVKTQFDNWADAWKKDTQTKKSYLWKQGINIGLGVAAVGANVAVAAITAPTGGGLVLPILGIIKSITKLAEDGCRLMRDIDDCVDRLEPFVKKLRTDCEYCLKGNRGATAAKHILSDALNEVSAGITHELASVFATKWLPASVGQFEGDLSVFSGKLSRLKVNMEAFNHKIDALLKVQKDMDAVEQNSGNYFRFPNSNPNNAGNVNKAILMQDARGIYASRQWKKLIQQTYLLIEHQTLTYQRIMGRYDFKYDHDSQGKVRVLLSKRTPSGSVDGIEYKQGGVFSQDKGTAVIKKSGLEKLEKDYQAILKQAKEYEKGGTKVLMVIAHIIIGLSDTIMGASTTFKAGMETPKLAKDIADVAGFSVEAAIDVGKLTYDTYGEIAD